MQTNDVDVPHPPPSTALLSHPQQPATSCSCSTHSRKLFSTCAILISKHLWIIGFDWTRVGRSPSGILRREEEEEVRDRWKINPINAWIIGHYLGHWSRPTDASDRDDFESTWLIRLVVPPQPPAACGRLVIDGNLSNLRITFCRLVSLRSQGATYDGDGDRHQWLRCMFGGCECEGYAGV